MTLSPDDCVSPPLQGVWGWSPWRGFSFRDAPVSWATWRLGRPCRQPQQLGKCASRRIHPNTALIFPGCTWHRWCTPNLPPWTRGPGVVPACQDLSRLCFCDGCAASNSALEPLKCGESRKSPFPQISTIQDYSPLLEYNNVHLEVILTTVH